MIYNVALISRAQQSDSVICVCVCIHFIFFSCMIYPRMLRIVPCSLQRELVSYPFYMLFVSADPKLPLHPASTPPPLAASLFSVRSLSLFPFWATPAAHGSTQARGQIRAAAANLHQQLTATQDPATPDP